MLPTSYCEIGAKCGAERFKSVRCRVGSDHAGDVRDEKYAHGTRGKRDDVRVNVPLHITLSSCCAFATDICRLTRLK